MFTGGDHQRGTRGVSFSFRASLIRAQQCYGKDRIKAFGERGRERRKFSSPSSCPTYLQCVIHIARGAVLWELPFNGNNNSVHSIDRCNSNNGAVLMSRLLGSPRERGREMSKERTRRRKVSSSHAGSESGDCREREHCAENSPLLQFRTCSRARLAGRAIRITLISTAEVCPPSLSHSNSKSKAPRAWVVEIYTIPLSLSVLVSNWNWRVEERA